MNKSYLALAAFLCTDLSGCASRTETISGYNTDYSYVGNIYPGRVNSVSYGSDFGQGYGLNHGKTDYEYGYGIDDYGMGYGIVKYDNGSNFILDNLH